MSNALPPTTQPLVVYHQIHPLTRIWGWLGWIGFLLCLVFAIGIYARYSDYLDEDKGLTQKFVSGDKDAEDKVAIIQVSGLIAEAGDGYVKKQIDRVRDDKHVKAIVVRVNSPGGTVSGSDYIFHHLTKLREEKGVPLVVSMGSMAASGGYYVSMAVGEQENSIFAEPTTTTGSIGVIIPHYDLSGLLERFDVKDDSIATNDRKQMLSMTKPISSEHRELIEAYIDQAFDRFKTVIKSGRPVFEKDESALDQLATGEIFSAEQALKHGLVDKIGFQEDAVERAMELAGLDKEKTRVVKFNPPLNLLGELGLMQAKSPQVFSPEALVELSTPKAYYMATMLPGAASY